MQVTASQLAIFEAGLQGLLNSQNATYTVDGKRIAAAQLAQPLDTGIKSALREASAAKKGGGARAGAPVHRRALRGGGGQEADGVKRGMTINPRNRFMYKVRRALF